MQAPVARARSTAPAPGAASPSVRSTEHELLDLQRQAGNAAVTSLLVQRKKAPAKPKAKPANVYNQAAYLNALQWLGANWSDVKDDKTYGPLYLSFGLDADDTKHFLPQHRTLLMSVAHAVRARKVNEWEAFDSWQHLGPQVRSEATQGIAAISKRQKIDASGVNAALGELDKNAFPAGPAYAALKTKTKQQVRPKAPDASRLDQLPAATQAFFETKKLYEDTAKLATSVLGTAADLKEHLGEKTGLPKNTAALIEIISSTASLDDKLAEARKKLDVFSAADLVNKVLSLSQATMTVTSELGVKYAAKSLAIAEGKQIAKDIGRYKTVLSKFENLGKMAKTAGNVATVISIAANYLKFVKAIWERKWDDVLSSGAELGLDIAGATIGGGAAGAAVIAGSVIVVKAQLEAVHLAAEFIRYCKDETVRQAADRFVKLATNLAKWYAWDLVADVEILLDPDKAGVHAVTSQQMEIHARKVAKGMRDLNEDVTATVPTVIGGHPKVKLALGSEALQALALPMDDGMSLVQQLESIFSGVDKMAHFVKDNYKN
jgi:hypothetical protein